MSTQEKDRAEDSEEKIREAFNQIWKRATNQSYEVGDRALMSIPPNKDTDADFIMHRAMDELFERRKKPFCPFCSGKKITDLSHTLEIADDD